MHTYKIKIKENLIKKDFYMYLSTWYIYEITLLKCFVILHSMSLTELSMPDICPTVLVLGCLYLNLAIYLTDISLHLSTMAP